MSFHRMGLLVVVLTFIVVLAKAQSANGTISGTVTDSSGAALQGVLVEALDPSKRVSATALTDSAGKYALVAPPGAYELRMRLPGFSEHAAEWRSVVNETASGDTVLEVAPLSERIAVTTAGPLPKQSEVSVQSAALPTSVTVINHDEVERTNVERDAGNLFRRVPGVMSHNIDQGETGTSIKMRGFLTLTHGADAAVYIDGVPQNVPSSAINHGMDDLSWLTPDMIERIEVIKGPFSALYGDQNRSGAVNIITRSSAKNSVGGTVGNYGNDRGSIVLSASRGSIQGFLVADLYRNAGYRDHALDNRGTVFAKVSLAKGASIWGFRGVHYKANWDAPGFLNLNSVLAGTVKVTDRDPTAPPLWGNGNRSSFVLTRTPARGEAGLFFSASAEDYSRTRAVGANQTDLNVQGDARSIMTARIVENTLLGPRAEAAFGAEVRRDRGDSINRRWSGIPSSNYTFDQDLNLVTGGLFAQGQVKPFDKLKLIGGIRFDGVHHDIKNRKLPDASVNYKQSVTTPRGGFVITPVRPLDIFANVGQGWRTPNQTEISPSGSLGPLGAPGGAAFPNLAPPKVTSYDFGATVQLVENRWRISAARFHTLNKSEIVAVAPNVFDTVGSTSRDGWELESRMIANERFSFYGSLGEITNARINNAAPGTAYLLSVPHDTVKAGFAYSARVESNPVLLNVDFFYVSSLPYFAGTPLVLQYSRGYTRFDVRLTYPFGKADLTTYATFQPLDYISEGANGAVAGLMYDHSPRLRLAHPFDIGSEYA